MISYKVLLMDFNGKIIDYDVMPYFYSSWEEDKSYMDYGSTGELVRVKVKTFDEFLKWFDRAAKYQYWARCEYEFIMAPWPYREKTPLEDMEHKKVDAYDQISLNIEIIARAMWEDLGYKE